MHYMLLGRWLSGISGLRKQQRSLHQASFTLHRLCCRFGGHKRFVERLGRQIKQARGSTATRLRSGGHVPRCCVGLHGSLLHLELQHLGLQQDPEWSVGGHRLPRTMYARAAREGRFDLQDVVLHGFRKLAMRDLRTTRVLQVDDDRLARALRYANELESAGTLSVEPGLKFGG